jgi:hypothetical protein
LTGHFSFHNNTVRDPVEVISDTDFPSERLSLNSLGIGKKRRGDTTGFREADGDRA